MSLNDIVSVVITSETAAVAQPSFSVINILSPECNFTNRINFYSTSGLSALAADLVNGTGSYTYQMASKISGQSPSVSTIAVSALATDKIIFVRGTMTAGAISMTVDGVPVSARFDGDLPTTIVDLVTAIEANTNVLATYDTTTTYANGYNAIVLTKSTPAPISVKDISFPGIAGTLKMFLSTPIVATFTGSMTGGKIATTLNGEVINTAFDSSYATTIQNLATTLATKASVATTTYTSSSITIVPAVGSATILDFNLMQALGSPAVKASFNYGSESIATALSAADAENSGWYGLVFVDVSSSSSTNAGKVTDSTAKALQLQVSDYAEANSKLTSLATSDKNVVNLSVSADTGASVPSLASTCSARAYARTAVIYSAAADTDFHDAAFIGKFLALPIGSWKADLLKLAAVSTDNLTTTQVANAKAKYCNIYDVIGGQNVVEKGQVSANEWIDTIVNIDWCKANVQLNVFQALLGNKKTPFDPAGIQKIVSRVQQIADQAISMTILSPISTDVDGVVNGGYVINYPDFSTITANDKNNRTLNGVSFIFYLAGAIQVVNITGIVTV